VWTTCAYPLQIPFGAFLSVCAPDLNLGVPLDTGVGHSRAPASLSRRIISWFPMPTAHERGVRPSLGEGSSAAAFTSAPVSKRTFAASSAFSLTAAIRSVDPS